MRILGITGRAGSGKTTLANLLFSCGWKPTRFAAPIKAMITELLAYQGLDRTTARRMVDGDLKEVPTQYLNDRTPRHAMQTLGTEWRNQIDRNLWVDAWKRSLALNFSQDSKILVDDCRFIHESNAVKAIGGKIILIKRSNNIISISSTAAAHISETEMAEISPDAIIINDAEPRKMLEELKTVIGEL